ncbi:MAG: hypothetical protein R2705_13210 [Ilumatobacteraceae bacterium]
MARVASEPVVSLSRRTFLAGSGALALAACGGAANTSGGSAGGSNASLDGALVLGRFNTSVLVPGAVRLPVSFGKDGVFFKDGPETVNAKVLDFDENVVVDGLIGTRHNVGIPNAYWLFTPTIEEPGIYRLSIEGANPDGQAFQLSDPSAIPIPLVGQSLPPFDTPTVDDGRGVDPICTDEPMCPFHEVTLTEALATGKPVVYLIGTPAYCQTGFCGPVLRLLEEVRDETGDDAVFVHSEVYTDRTIAKAAPAVDAYHLAFEPVLFVADATGTIVTRLDAVMDKAEMLAAVTAVL